MQWQLRSLLVSHGWVSAVCETAAHKLWLLGGRDVVVTLLLVTGVRRWQLIDVEVNVFLCWCNNV